MKSRHNAEGLMRGIIIGTVAILLAAAPSARAVDYIRQFRSVDATAGGTAHEESTALGFWSDTANVALATASLPPFLIAEGFAKQSSSLSDSLINMSGTLSAYGAEFGQGSGRSELTVEFSLDAPSPYFGTVSTSGATETSITASAGWNPLGSGTLAPGDYSLSVVFDLAAESGSSSNGTYMYRLSLTPEPSSLCLFLGGFFLLVAAQRIRL
jgi:hypothetical protein